MQENYKLGPEGADKIAIIGSAPSSTLIAPFDDPSWAIWCTSPSVFAQTASKRTDTWFELHRWIPYPPGQNGLAGTKPWFSPEFRQFLREYKGTVFMTEKQPDIPNCVQFPYQMLLDKHGPYHFGSSIAWMIAMAIEMKPKAIGLFGIDMAAGEEWAYQRPSCQHFLGLAKALGIEVVLPPESDLMRHTTLYGIGEHNLRHIKLTSRMEELTAREQSLMNAINQYSGQLQEVRGAKNMLQYMIDVWADDINGTLDQAVSFSGSFVKTVPAVPVVDPKPFDYGTEDPGDGRDHVIIPDL